MVLLAIVLMMIGFYPVIARPNLVKKIVGLSLFQTGIFLFFIALGKVEPGTAPVMDEAGPVQSYTNPLPTALILTAIVVSVSTLAVALGIVVRIRQAYGTVEDGEIESMDRRDPE